MSAPATNGHRNGRARSRSPAGIAVVGLGYWGPNLVRVLHELPRARVAFICDLKAQALSRVGRRYPAVKRTKRFEQLLKSREVDAVAIATPVSSHYELAKAALEAGKHVFVEKPLAASSDEALELIALAAEQELVLMPGHTFLYSPPVNMIRDLIQSGELGEIHFISTSRVNLGLHQPDVSVVWDLGPHDFSILRHWLDETPSRVSAMSRGCVMPDTPDVAFINLEFPSGTLVHVELSWLAPSKLRRTAIVGSRKMVVYDDTSAESVRIFDSGVSLPNPETFGEFQLSYRTGDIISPPIDASEPLALEMRDFCDAVRIGTSPRSAMAMGLDVLRVIEAVDASLANGGAPVVLKPDRVEAA
jgi:predicted dehydrogenase